MSNNPWTFGALMALCVGLIPISAQAGETERVHVERIQIVGDIPEEAEPCLRRNVDQHVPTKMGALQLYALQQRLTRQCYVERGYSSSGLSLPPQDVSDGVVQFQSRSGLLTEVILNGDGFSNLAKRRLHSHWSPLIAKALHQKSVRRVLKRLEQEESIDAVHALIEPVPEVESKGSVPSRIEIELVSAAKWNGFAQLDNHQPASVGEWGATVRVLNASLTRNMDPLTLDLKFSEGITGGGLAYQFPVSRSWSTFLSANSSLTNVVEEPFDEVDIETRLLALEAGVIGRWLPDPHREWRTALSVQYRKAQSHLLGQPFSFSSGPERGRSVVSALNWQQQWSAAWFKGRKPVVQLRAVSSLSAGMPWFSATRHNDDRPDCEFLRWRLNMTGLYWLPVNWERPAFLRVDARGQLSDQPLLPVERFSVGGHAGVRGYRENTLVRDNGWTTGLDAGLWLARNGRGELKLSAEVFAEIGRAFNKAGRGGARAEESLKSVGIALKWRPALQWQLSASFALPLEDRPNNHNSLQDEGVHLSLRRDWGRRS